MCATKLVEVNVQGILIIVIIKIELIECLYHNVITLPKFKVENMNNVKLQEIIVQWSIRYLSVIDINLSIQC